MNRRASVWVGWMLSCGCVTGLTSAVRGQGAPPSLPPGAGATPVAAAAGIPLAVKGAADAATAKLGTPQVRAFIAAQMTGLQSADSTVQRDAQRALSGECANGTVPFYVVYGQELNNAALPLLTSTAPMRLRLNLAVVAAKASAQSRGTVLGIQPLVMKLMADRDDAVALWGVKAAHDLVLELLQPGGAAPGAFLGAVVQSVKSRPPSDLSGYLAIEAYHTLLVPPTVQGVGAQGTGAAPPPIPLSVSAVYAPLLDLFEFRIASYKAGAVPAPGAEREVPNFLFKNFGSFSPPLVTRTLQDLVDLESAGGQRADQLVYEAEDLNQLRATLKYAASALWVLVHNTPNAPAGINALDWLRNIPPGATPVEIATHAGQVFAIVQVAFKGVTAPPALPPLPPPTPPVAPVVVPAAPGGATPPRTLVPRGPAMP